LIADKLPKENVLNMIQTYDSKFVLNQKTFLMGEECLLNRLNIFWPDYIHNCYWVIEIGIIVILLAPNLFIYFCFWSWLINFEIVVNVSLHYRLSFSLYGNSCVCLSFVDVFKPFCHLRCLIILTIFLCSKSLTRISTRISYFLQRNKNKSFEDLMRSLFI
jgi:hypothetical protein